MERIDWSKAPHWADRVVRSPRQRQLFWADDNSRQLFWADDNSRQYFVIGQRRHDKQHIRDNWEVVERRPEFVPGKPLTSFSWSCNAEPAPVTIEQRIASLCALEKQVEETRAELTRDLESLGLTWMVRDEPEQTTITDWRDLRVGDVVEYVEGTSVDHHGKYGTISNIDENDYFNRIQVLFDGGALRWCSKWRFIRRP